MDKSSHTSGNIVNKYSAINRVMTPYLEFLENKKRLDKLKDNLDEEQYNKIKSVLDGVNFDFKTFHQQLKNTVKTGQILNNKNDSSTEESDVDSSDEKEITKEVDKVVETKHKKGQRLEKVSNLKKRLF